MKRLLVIAGEISGDQYGAALVEKLKQWDCHITAIGGDKLKAVSDNFLLETVHKSVIGVSVFFQKFFALRNLFSCLRDTLSQDHYDRVILIDYQHHSEKIGKLCKKKGILVTTFISPHFWMWQDIKSAKRLLSYTDQLITIFKKEYEFYSSLTSRVFYFGHPLTELLSVSKDSSSLGKPPFLAIFPGSRKQEFKLYLVPILESIKKIKKQYPSLHYVMAVSSPRYKSILVKNIKKIGLEKDIQLWEESSTALLRHATCIICGSGTSNLEALWYKIPLVVLAALPPLTYKIAKYVLRIKMPYVSLANIVAGKKIVEEIVQSQINAENIYKGVSDILEKRAIIQFEEMTSCLYQSPHPLYDSAFVIMNSVSK